MNRTIIRLIRPYLAMAAIVDSGLAVITFGVVRSLSKPVDDFLTLTTELMAEEVDVSVIEGEIVTADKGGMIHPALLRISLKVILENIEETDIYDLL